MGKIAKQKQKVESQPSITKPIKPFKTSPSLISKNQWKKKPTAIVLPSKNEPNLLRKLKTDFNDSLIVKTKLDKPAVSFPVEPIVAKQISKSVKTALGVKKKVKRLEKKHVGFKPLTAVEMKCKERSDRSVNRFLYYDHAEVTEEDVDERWTIDDLLGGSEADLSGGVEVNKMVCSEMMDEDVEEEKEDMKEEVEEPKPKKQKNQRPITFFVKPTENDSLNVFLKKNAVVHIHGLFEMQVLFGSVEILGKKLDVNTDPVKVYSPRGTTFLSIKNLNTSDTEQYQQIKEKLTEQEVKVKSEHAIINCKPIKSKLVHILEENLSQVLFPTIEDGVKCVFRDYLKDDWSVFQENEQWSRVLEKIKVDSRVMLCGGKGLGKSTLLRFLVNRLLEKFEAVSVIDLDAGQSEFTVPGCISTVVVKEPLLGPNYTHLKKPERCIFIPNMDISSNYKAYLLGIKELVRFPKLPFDTPVIINYMGFTKGLGMNLAAAAITEVEPTLVVQIDSHLIFKNYQKDLTPENVYSSNNLLIDKISGKVNYELMKINTVINYGNVWELQPRQMREMSLLAYFTDVLPDACTYFTEAGVKLYRTNLSDVKIIHGNKECDPMAINANLVSLCTQVGESTYECYGWGIVRNVSVELGYLTLITPLDECELELVDHLILGSVTLPPSIYFRNHSEVTGHVPYVYVGDMQNFAKAPKRAIVPKK